MMLRIFLLVLMVISCKAARTGEGKFIADPHYKKRWPGDRLIQKVHDKRWDIAFNFAPDCPANRKSAHNIRILQGQIVEYIKLWLAPLRELAEIHDKDLVNKFIFHKTKLNPNNDLTDPIYTFTEGGYKENNSRIGFIFYCRSGLSFIRNYQWVNILERSDKFVHIAPNLPYIPVSFVHEIGHAFGLHDTYLNFWKRRLTGITTIGAGLDRTLGTQPASIMASYKIRRTYSQLPDNIALSNDDREAIRWLYRYHFDGDIDLTDCLNDDYVYEKVSETVGGCVPKYPLIFEAKQGHSYYVYQMLADDDDLEDVADETGNTALHYITAHQDDWTYSMMKKYLAYGATKVNRKNNAQQGRNTALHLAVAFDNQVIVRMLLAVDNIELNAQNILGMTPLHYAAKRGHIESLSHLLRHKNIEVNIKDRLANNSPLHEAAQNGHTEIVKILLAHKDINRNLRNRANKTARQLAELNGYEETVKAFD